MVVLKWSEALAVNVAAMDSMHQEFFDLIAAIEQAKNEDVASLWQALIAHTQDHFGQENSWMHATGYAEDNCHTNQHHVVLELMRESANRCVSGDVSMIRHVAPELASWLKYHIETMDSALATHLQHVGFDVATGEVHNKSALPEASISGCGGACSNTAVCL